MDTPDVTDTVPPELWETHRKPPPHDDRDWIQPVARIRCNSTGEVRLYEALGTLDENPGWPSTYIWEEGNYACDCNRALFFGYAVGLTYEQIDHPCGEGAFSVNLLHPKSRTVFYREFDE